MNKNRPYHTTKQSLCIEFLGLPGSGKSTFAKQIAETLIAHGFDVIESTAISKNPVWFSFAKKLIAQPMHTVKVLYILSLASFECSKTIIPAGQKKAFLRRCLLFVRRFKSLWKRWFAWEAETEQCDEISGIHSPKERMGQLLWRVAFWARHDGVWILDSLATKIPFGNVLIILQACPETLQKRIEQKEKKGGINQLLSGSSQRTQLWSEASLFMSHMLKLIQERKLNALIIEIDTQRESIEKNVAKICEKIEATARKS